MPSKLSKEILVAAFEGFQAQKSRLDAKIAELQMMLSSASPKTPVAEETSARQKTRLSAVGKSAIAEANRRRWAALRFQKKGVGAPVTKSSRKKVR
jgi:hypothetical protein